ncbi:hypothetical protein GGR38_004768 [Novosphingobium sediminicola]|uniref:Uncharacterized protein n=1 Tax=Novosphingobium sediminicola TaxID=563162 RepID=A0A7W6G8V7_9SPHN|nr:hypothetical protein [Novosphingobium sediminicola]
MKCWGGKHFLTAPIFKDGDLMRDDDKDDRRLRIEAGFILALMILTISMQIIEAIK